VIVADPAPECGKHAVDAGAGGDCSPPYSRRRHQSLPRLR